MEYIDNSEARSTDAIGYDPYEGEYDIYLTDEDLADYEQFIKEMT